MRAKEDAASPFVVVHEGRYARILLAELVGDDGVAQSRFAWKLRVDDVAGGGVAGGGGGGVAQASQRPLPSNGELDRRWQQERTEVLRAHSPHVVSSIAVPPALTQSLPVFYCRRADTYFHPVCPDTGGLLSVCRDDTRLAAGALPPYVSDTVRYLHCATRTGPAVFYRTHGEPATTRNARIATRQELVRGWSRIANGEVAAPDLPCQTCEHRGECYPGGEGPVPADQHLYAVSFYDVDSLALQLAAMDFDTAVMRLGGGLENGDPQNGNGRAWMSNPGRRCRTLEVLRLKVAAFADVCRGVRALHEAGRPHLGVSPANVVAFDAGGGSSLPSNWQLRFALTDLGGAIPVEVPGADAVEVLWQPGREVVEDETSRLFLAPLLRSLEGGSVTMSIACREVPDVDGSSRMVVDVHRAGVPSFVLPGDLLVVQPVGTDFTALARVDEVGARGLVATVLSNPIPDPACSAPAFDAKLSFVRRSGPSADLYGLGMLLLRMLLVHDEQALAQVSGAVERCLQLMAAAPAVDGGIALADRWQEILLSDEGEGRFASWHVMHRRCDRQEVFDAELQGETIVPKVIWKTLMGLAGKLLLASPTARAKESTAAVTPMAGVLAEIESVERQLHVELFESASRDEAIAEVCAQRLVALRSEVGAVSADGTPSADSSTDITASPDGAIAEDSTGFVLAVGRVGESTIQHYHFTQDRVTIGRRQGDVLLVLSDPMVSSKHAVIERADGEFVLYDCGSTNGTEVDGIRLPIEVPHALDDGSVIHIRPFMLSFRLAEAEAAQTVNVQLKSVEEVCEQLRVTYARCVHRGEREVRVALSDALEDLRSLLGRRGLVESLEAIVTKYRSGPAGAEPEDGPAQVDAERSLGEVALRAVRQLARGLTESASVEREQHLVEFLGRVQRFVDVTSRWIEGMLEWRGVFNKQLDLRATQMGGARPPLRSAAEVREELLAHLGTDDGVASSDYFLSRFYDDVLSILEGLLLGNQQVRNAIREQLDPDRLVAEAGREAKLGLLVQAAAGSALWKLYVSTFRGVTEADDYETELQRLLDLAEHRRADRQ